MNEWPLNSGEGGGFVFGEIEDGIEANHFDEHEDALGGGEEGAFAASALEGGEGADQGADAGAVEFGDAGKIDGNVGGTGVEQLLHLGTEGLFGVTELQRAVEVENGSRTGFSEIDVHRCPRMRRQS